MAGATTKEGGRDGEGRGGVGGVALAVASTRRGRPSRRERARPLPVVLFWAAHPSCHTSASLLPQPQDYAKRPMAKWYDGIPHFTSPPTLAAVPPKPPFDFVLEPTDIRQPQPSLEQASLARLPHDGEVASAERPEWCCVAQCTARSSVEAWSTVMLSLVRYPERNSKNILRADILADEEQEEADEQMPPTSSWRLKQRILRRLLSCRPGFNSRLDQLCSFYDAHDGRAALVTYTALMRDGSAAADGCSIDEYLAGCVRPMLPSQIPFYHPALLSLAYTYHQETSSTDPSSHGTLGIHFLPFDASPIPPNLQRIAQSLLKTVHVHSWGIAHSYTPRVEHDRLVPRALFQDVYLNLKHRWADWLVKQWREGTDPSKHVHEDLGIAAWLMCFWTVHFGGRSTTRVDVGLMDRPWLADEAAWPRPPGGFVDVGCGNGLLVFLLNNEGYAGHGFDLRPRRSWDLFRHAGPVKIEYSQPSKDAGPIKVSVEVRPADLRVDALDALAFIQSRLSGTAHRHDEVLPPGSFLIGNHADELTPIMPLLGAVVPACSGLLNIPCCPWQLDGPRFTRGHYKVSRAEVASLLDIDIDDAATLPPPEKQALLQRQMDEISLGPAIDPHISGKKTAAGSGGSKNVAYLAYVSHVHLQAGWLVEKEALRIPSTKNWAVVATRRSGGSEAEVAARIAELIGGAVEGWKARDLAGEGQWFRKGEGNDGERH